MTTGRQKGGTDVKGPTHSAFARILARLVTYHGFAPRLHDLLLADVDLFARSMALPDNAIEVAIRMPSGEFATSILGNTTEPLCHFEPGYLWSEDPTLSIGGALVDAAAHLCGATVEFRTDGVRPPRVPMAEQSPFVRALEQQPHRTITDFRFPAASEMASYYTRAARAWLDVGNVSACIECLAYGGGCRFGFLGCLVLRFVGHGFFSTGLSPASNSRSASSAIRPASVMTYSRL
jgi:hypothetical protein